MVAGKMKMDPFRRVKTGYGIPYGFLGINGEIGSAYVSAHAGIGYVAFVRDVKGAIGYTIGMRGYFMKPEKNIRIRLSASYGVNGAYLEDNKQYVVRGFSVGAGMEHKFIKKKNLYYDLDIIVPLLFTNNTRPQNEELEINSFPSFGVGWKF